MTYGIFLTLMQFFSIKNLMMLLTDTFSRSIVQEIFLSRKNFLSRVEHTDF